MLKRVFATLFSGLLAAVLPACDGFNLGKLNPGVSTMQEVRDIMGVPTMEWQDADGAVTWEYPRTPNGIVNYMIDFRPDKILREVRQVLAEAYFSRVREGMTRADIRQLLGQPASEQYFTLKKEHVWEWKTKNEGGYDYFFDVYFDDIGRVIRTGTHMRSTSGG